MLDILATLIPFSCGWWLGSSSHSTWDDLLDRIYSSLFFVLCVFCFILVIKFSFTLQHTHTHTRVIPEGFEEGWILPSQIQPYDIRMQDPFCWSWSTLFQVTKNKKIMYFEYFLPIHQVGTKWTTKNSILLRSTSLDMQILDPTISSLSKHLKLLTHHFF